MNVRIVIGVHNLRRKNLGCLLMENEAIADRPKVEALTLIPVITHSSFCMKQTNLTSDKAHNKFTSLSSIPHTRNCRTHICVSNGQQARSGEQVVRMTSPKIKKTVLFGKTRRTKILFSIFFLEQGLPIISLSTKTSPRSTTIDPMSLCESDFHLSLSSFREN